MDSQQKKALVFVSAGLGDAILLVPLVKLLRENKFAVTALVTTRMPLEELLESTGLFDQLILARTKTGKAWLALKEYHNFNLALVNYFAATRSNLFLAKRMATRVHTNRIPDKAGKRLTHGLVYLQPKKDIHDAEQNVLLAGKGSMDIKAEHMRLTIPNRNTLNLQEGYIILQISAIHNKQEYKNWGVPHWIRFLKLCKDSFPKLRFVMLGDQTETSLGAEVMAAGIGNTENQMGKTNIREAWEAIEKSQLFIGVDGGLMHLAVAAGKPTLTLWGPSSPILYGYERINPEMHRVVSLNLPCAPCSAWISPNTTRFPSPEACPLRECLSTLSPEQVFGEFTTFVKKHALV